MQRVTSLMNLSKWMEEQYLGEIKRQNLKWKAMIVYVMKGHGMLKEEKK